MCGRYALVKTREVAERFGVQQSNFEVDARYNVAPGQNLPIVTRHSPKQLEEMRWGLVPFWAKDTKIGYQMINARSEGIEDKPAFRRPLRQQRCIVPANGFYEWEKVGKIKVPHYFKLLNDQLFGFAGLYDIYTDAEGNKLKSYTIITTEANEMVAPIHNRMPVILSPKNEEIWLNPDLHDPAELLPLLKPYPVELMESYIVSTLVNKPQNDSPQLLERVA